MTAQPVAGLAQAAEREQVKACNRILRVFEARLQAADNFVRSGIGEQTAVATDLAAQRPDRVTDAATQRKLHQRRRRGRPGKADDNRKSGARGFEFADPGNDRRALEAELRNDLDPDPGLAAPVPPRAKRLESVRPSEIGMSLGMACDTHRRHAMRLDQPAMADIQARP